jgi:HEAT repeat protein
MDIEAHRKDFLSKIAKAASAASVTTPQALAAYAASKKPAAQKMSDMIRELPLDQKSFQASVRVLLDILGNESLDPACRIAALGQLGAAEFQPIEFAAFHAEFIELLRRLAVSPDKDVRTAALERLTLTNDPEAQKLLQEGLEKTRKPLVTAAKAIQLLARDDHGGAIPLFRRLAAEASGQVREQALRALAADTKSVPLFESIASDKKERTQLRQIAVVNLKNTSATRFAKLASNLALDNKEDDKLRAVAVSAIAHTSAVADKLKSPAFAQSLQKVGSSTGSRALKASIDRFSKARETKKT